MSKFPFLIPKLSPWLYCVMKTTTCCPIQYSTILSLAVQENRIKNILLQWMLSSWLRSSFWRPLKLDQFVFLKSPSCCFFSALVLLSKYSKDINWLVSTGTTPRNQWTFQSVDILLAGLCPSGEPGDLRVTLDNEPQRVSPQHKKTLTSKWSTNQLNGPAKSSSAVTLLCAELKTGITFH